MAIKVSAGYAVPYAPVMKLDRPAGPSQSDVPTLPTESIAAVCHPPTLIMVAMSSKVSWSSSSSHLGSSYVRPVISASFRPFFAPVVGISSAGSLYLVLS